VAPQVGLEPTTLRLTALGTANLLSDMGCYQLLFIDFIVWPIEEMARRDEAHLYAEYERERPQILGGLFTAVAAGLARLPETRLSRKPRMADFAQWATATEEALDFESGAFMRAYSGNRAEAVQETLESDLVSAAIVALLREHEVEEAPWTGTSSDLLKKLELIVMDSVKKSPA
jgi:hypothetical protein